MAKKRPIPENMVEEIMETTKKVSKEAEMIDAQRRVEQEDTQVVVYTQPQQQTQTATNTKTRYSYEADDELRTVRLQAVITPSVRAKLQKAVDDKKIKSINDLINYLLKEYIEEQGW